MQPIGCIRPRSLRPRVPDGYEYPIYLHAKAPLHDYYDTAGSIMSPVGKITIDFRTADYFSDVDYVRAGFSHYVLATDRRIDGPADLRRYEVGTLSTPREEIEIALDRKDKLVCEPRLPPHRLLAVALGIDPERFDAVDLAWQATKDLGGEDPEENDEFYDKLDEILDIQDIEENAEYDSVFGDDDEVTPSVGFSQEPTVLMTESLAPTAVDTTADGEAVPGPSKAGDPDGVPDITKALRALAIMGLDPDKPDDNPVDTRTKVLAAVSASAVAFGANEALTVLTKKGRHKSSRLPRLKKPKDPFGDDTGTDPSPGNVDSSTKHGPGRAMGEDRNPRKVERRKSFERAASKLAAIPRTKSGEERLRILSYEEDLVGTSEPRR